MFEELSTADLHLYHITVAKNIWLAASTISQLNHFESAVQSFRWFRIREFIHYIVQSVTLPIIGERGNERKSSRSKSQKIDKLQS